MNQTETIVKLTEQLNDFDADTRQAALQELLHRVDAGEIDFPAPAEVANMHCHTFFSFNAYGYSPAALAWLGKQEGYKLMGTVDFDVLDAVDEWLADCELVGLRGSAGVETRAFVPEFTAREINSPGEPGVLYHMGIGFTSGSVPDAAASIAADLRQRARARNLDVLARVNAYLDPVTLDYEADVLPLTPNGVATERHMVTAYAQAAARSMPDLAEFWAAKLGMTVAQVQPMLPTSAALQNAIRSKLMKRGGVGYVQPGPDSFPSIEEFHKLILACDALPCAAWLDGQSAGEQAMPELLDLLITKGVVAINIVPDRNWDIADAETKRIKLQKLYEVVELAQSLDLPINIGTEMNSFGNKLIDDFAAPELAPVRDAFMDGAYFIYGHTVLQRHAGLGYQSAWAQSNLPSRKQKNDFYTQAGRLIPPTSAARTLVQSLSADLTPPAILSQLSEIKE